MKLPYIRFLFKELRHPIAFDVINDDKLSDFDNRFRIILRKHFMILACWSILNCVTGSIAMFIQWSGAYYFWMMNCVWGMINFAVAIAFFYHTIYKKLRKRSIYECLVMQSHVEKMMFLNIGIDVAFVFVGLWLRENSFMCDVNYPDMWLGFGWAIVMQGFFLLIQDITFLCLYRRNFQIAQLFLET